MAEALAVVGLAVSVFQFVDFASKVLDRLRDFQSSIHDVPKAFRDIITQLPLLIDTLRRTQHRADSGHVTTGTANVLIPVVEGCLLQVKRLEDILVKAVPTKGSPGWERHFKALCSLRCDKTVQQITSTLQTYVQYLIYHEATGNFMAQSAIPPSQVDPEPSRPRPCFMVKYNQDPSFIGREDVISEIDSGRRYIGDR